MSCSVRFFGNPKGSEICALKSVCSVVASLTVEYGRRMVLIWSGSLQKWSAAKLALHGSVNEPAQIQMPHYLWGSIIYVGPRRRPSEFSAQSKEAISRAWLSTAS
jgi:hypothetical protein